MRKFHKINDNELNKYSSLFTKDDIILPKRQTKASSGYDFYIPYDLVIKPNEFTKIFSGVKAELEDSDFLAIFIRSSMAIKKGLNLTNQVGIIDSDYYNNPDNDGHIIIAVHNISDKDVVLNKGDRVAQGIILKYEKTTDDFVQDERVGGIGSTK